MSGGGREPEFEPLTKNERIVSENGKAAKLNKKVGKEKGKSGIQAEPEKKFSNHIEFVDYIPTHEVVTYRHLFAYGFYVV